MEIITTIFSGIFVATFLRNTSRVLRALELCKECLILLNNKALAKENKIVELAYKTTYLSLLETYCLIKDYSSGIECGRKLLHFLRVSGEKSTEAQVTYYLENYTTCRVNATKQKGFIRKHSASWYK